MRKMALALPAMMVAGCTGEPVEPVFNGAGTRGGGGVSVFSCTFTVPDTPAYTEQALFLWCGVQPSTNREPSFGVLQPVLAFGSACVLSLPEGEALGPGNDPTYESNPYWYYSAMYVFPNPQEDFGWQCTSGPVFKARPGDVLVSTLTLAASGATVSIAAPDGTRKSTLSVAGPRAGSETSWGPLLGSDKISFVAFSEWLDPSESSEYPEALLNGWSMEASILPANILTHDQWQLAPRNNPSLTVSCSYDASKYGSTCTWAR
jgi:hypothetical protein